MKSNSYLNSFIYLLIAVLTLAACTKVYFPECEQIELYQTLNLDDNVYATTFDPIMGDVFILHSKKMIRIILNDDVGNMRPDSKQWVPTARFDYYYEYSLALDSENVYVITLFNNTHFELFTVNKITMEQVGNYTLIEMPENMFYVQYTVELATDYYSDSLYILGTTDELSSNQFLFVVNKETYDYEVLSFRANNPKKLVISGDFGYFKTLDNIYQFSLSNPTSSLFSFGTGEQVGSFEIAYGEGDNYNPDAMIVGTSTVVQKVKHSDPTSMFTDLTIDMTNDNEWQPPMDSAYDNETGMTYWVTSLYNSENFQFNWYLFRVSSSPFQLMNNATIITPTGKTKFTNPFVAMYYYRSSDSVFIISTQNIYKYNGANCHSSVPLWLWILFGIVAAFTVATTIGITSIICQKSFFFVRRRTQSVVVDLPERSDSEKARLLGKQPKITIPIETD